MAQVRSEDTAELLEKLLQCAVDDFAQCTSAEQRRGALCRYVKRGTTAGFSTAALVDFLGVSSPSVLERAGYAQELELLTMEELGTLSDEEIERTDVE